jgi:hypothetical protein
MVARAETSSRRLQRFSLADFCYMEKWEYGYAHMSGSEGTWYGPDGTVTRLHRTIPGMGFELNAMNTLGALGWEAFYKSGYVTYFKRRKSS